MDFNTENAKKIIQWYAGLLSAVEQAEDTARIANQQLEQSLNGAVLQNVFSDWIRNCLQGDIDSVAPQGAYYFLNAAWKVVHSEELVHLAENLDQNFHERIRGELAIVKSRTSGVRWLFTSRQKKQQAERAFQDLIYLSNSEYGPVAQGVAANLQDRQEGIPINEVLADIDRDKDRYRLKLQQELPENVYEDPLVQVFSALLSQTEKIQERISTAEESADACRDRIKKQAERARQRQAYRALSSISVDELKRETAGGIRIKPLKDAGYDTVADVYSANVYQLISVNGVSEFSARELKQAAAKYAETVSKTTKLKLSADENTSEATELLKQVYQFKAYRPDLDTLNRLHQYDHAVDRAVKSLKSVGNGALWAFYNRKEKEDVSQAYNYLGSVIFADYGRDAEQLTILQERSISAESVWDDFQKDPVSYSIILGEICPDLLGNGDDLYGLPEDLAREIQDEAFFPDGLKCDLYPYQVMGVKYILHQKRVLLGDEMGLGKTIQAIAAMVSLKNTGATHFIVVCPASVLINWSKEITGKSKLRATVVHGTGKSNALKGWMATGGVAVTTYETTGIFAEEGGLKADLLVVDEAHYIKNTDAKRSQNVRALASKTDRLLFMSGTPLENKVDEMISLIEVLQPRIAAKIQNIAFMSTAPEFRQAIAPVYYRRKRENVLTELPEKEEIEEWCDLKPLERELYEESTLGRNFMEMRRVSWNVDDLKDSSKFDHLKSLVEQATEEGRKILVFSFFRNTIDKIADAFGEKCMGPITGSVSPKMRQGLIDRYEKAPAGTILLSQIQAGGTGLNIQSASVVIICEPQLKPSIENQAVSRAYRMGQSRNVLVYRLLCADSVDERMLERLHEKQQEFDAFADKSVAAESQEREIDKNTINDIIQEEIDRINKEKEQAGKETY